LSTPRPLPPGFSLGAVPPQSAVEAFAQRKLLRPTFRWQDIWQAEHARAFAVAGVMRLDVLELIRAELEAALAEGTSPREFATSLKAKLQAKGFWGLKEITDPTTGEVRRTRFNDARLRLIFDVNIRQSHAAGRWARLVRDGATHVVYRTMGDERVRMSHRPWDNLMLPVDDAFWRTHFPPNGWRCRCTAYGWNEADGLPPSTRDRPLKRTAPPTQYVSFTNRSTGQTELVPRGIDPGFAYNPGQVHVQRAAELLERGLAAVKPVRRPAGTRSVDAASPHAVRRAVVARTRSEKAFGDFLASPPAPAQPGQRTGLPVAAVPAREGEPPIASVAAIDLAAQARAQRLAPSFPSGLPLKAAQWALAQAVLDQGQRLDLGEGRVLWWWRRSVSGEPKVLLLELERSALVWWTKFLGALTEAEARRIYPALKEVL
jgi:SPP1 gp7 family putative phage head morphogenesis protein